MARRKKKAIVKKVAEPLSRSERMKKIWAKKRRQKAKEAKVAGAVSPDEALEGMGNAVQASEESAYDRGFRHGQQSRREGSVEDIERQLTDAQSREKILDETRLRLQMNFIENAAKQEKLLLVLEARTKGITIKI